MTEQQKAKEIEKKEREIYGRYWIWEEYFSEKNEQKWLDTAEELKHVNPQVIQDIEDFLLLKGFKESKKEVIKELIEADRLARI